MDASGARIFRSDGVLVLTRREGEWIQVGDNIRVYFVKSKPEKAARIGIDAPRHVKVLRGELLEPRPAKEV